MNKVKKYREQLGLTQPELAEKSGLSVRTISRIEAGIANMTQKTGERLAEALDCTYVDLIVEEPLLRDASLGLSTTEENIIDVFRELDKKGQEELLSYLNYQKYRARTTKKRTG